MRYLKRFNESYNETPTKEEILILIECFDGDVVGEISEDSIGYYEENISEDDSDIEVIKKYMGCVFDNLDMKLEAENDFDYDEFKVDMNLPDGNTFEISGKWSGFDKIIKSITLKK